MISSICVKHEPVPSLLCGLIDGSGEYLVPCQQRYSRKVFLAGKHSCHKSTCALADYVVHTGLETTLEEK